MAATLLLLGTSQAQAFSQETHKRIVLDAVNYMQQHPASTEYAALRQYAAQNNLTISESAELLGQAAYDVDDVDDFEDTFLCGAITGSCVQAPV